MKSGTSVLVLNRLIHFAQCFFTRFFQWITDLFCNSLNLLRTDWRKSYLKQKIQTLRSIWEWKCVLKRLFKNFNPEVDMLCANPLHWMHFSYALQMYHRLNCGLMSRKTKLSFKNIQILPKVWKWRWVLKQITF